MEESILLSIKQSLGLDKEYTPFDPDVIMHINSVFMVLNQLGVGPEDGFVIEDDTSMWNEYLTNPKELQGVRTYIYLKVKLIFDPPLNSSVLESMKQSINEFEWRLNAKAESNK